MNASILHLHWNNLLFVWSSGTTATVASVDAVEERVAQQLVPSNRPSGADESEAVQPPGPITAATASTSTAGSTSDQLMPGVLPCSSSEQMVPDELEPWTSQELEDALMSE
ncbi:uncharacterized protein LOC125944469 [Dermacentor silvarum]|uniref:uncharacterized protein LOC125944469 n=1 Tax=Dermacentor silvarum TaxID=543639 RepID=UPI0021018A75|nr:uncharacterized protein LOC125944469 [Dermacentor silvarum]